MSEAVVVDFVANDKVSGKIIQIGSRLKSIGDSITRAFTMPFVNLGRFLAQGVMQTETFKKAVEPIQAEFQKIYEKIATMLVPVIKQLTPAFEQFVKIVLTMLPQFTVILKELTPLFIDLIKLAGQFAQEFGKDIQENLPAIRELIANLREVVAYFSQLDPATKQAIINFIGFMAVMGPIISTIGNFMLVLGKLVGLIGGILSPIIQFLSTSVLPTLGAVFAGITLPVWALIAAIILLIAEIILFGPQAAESFKMLVEIIQFYAGKAMDVISAMVKNMVDIIRSVDWVAVGAAIMMGIITGIVNNAGGLAQALINAVLAAIAAAVGAAGGGGSGEGGGRPGEAARLTPATEGGFGATLRPAGARERGGGGPIVNIGTLNLGSSKMTRGEMESMVRDAMIGAMGAR